MIILHIPWYSPKEVAILLGYHPVHVRRLISQEKLPADKMENGTRRVPHAAVMAWAKKRDRPLHPLCLL